MRTGGKILLLGAALLTLTAPWGPRPATADGQALPADDPKALEQRAAELRRDGPAALDKLLVQREQLQQSLSKAASGRDAEALKKQAEQLDRLIDLVGGQRYCTASKLFWYTDLDAARKAAQDSGKPILSLRMMGRLTDEFSCANSRFFRTTLYSNEAIGKLLREGFVLHWKSVRPVPKVTIDYGDGRVVQRTLTGNSIHYVLDEQGRVLDGLPGLYGPQQFEAWLQEMLQGSVSLRQIDKGAGDAAVPERVKELHATKLAEVVRAWQADVARIKGVDNPEAIRPGVKGGRGPNGLPAFPPADEAARIARPKSGGELPIIQGVMGQPNQRAALAALAAQQERDANLARAARLEKETDDAMWDKIAALHKAGVKLDEASLAVIRGQNPTAAQAGRLAATKSEAEDPLVRMLAKLQTSIAVDTVRNEYELHRRLHEWVVAGTAPRDVEELNDKVYAELFLTPRADPWLGLVPADVYTGLENNGVTPEKSPGRD
jgi:hypothetical protein